MLNLIIIDEDSRINGIKTYIGEIIRIFKRLNARIYLINHFNGTKELFTAKEEEGIYIFSFSYCLQESYNKIVDKFLGLHIKDSDYNLFMLNYTPCEDLVLTLRNRFPKSKITFTVHDMSWTYHFLGDVEKFKAFCREMDYRHDTEKQKNLRKDFLEEQRMFRLVDKVIVLACETFKVLTEIYQIDACKLCYIPNGTEDLYQPIPENEKADIRKNKHLDRQEKIILFAGRGHYIKGLYALLRCLGKILEVAPECRLVIVGSLINPVTTLRLAKAYSSKIVFTGQLSRDELLEWYKIADVGLLTSYVEQCSYTGIERMMHGIPVLASDGFCVGNMFKDGENSKVAKIGKRSDPEKTEEFDNNLIESLLAILSSPDEREKLGKNGRKLYLSNYQFQQMQDGYEKLVALLFGKI